MCGIAGVYSFLGEKKVSRQIIEQMTNAIEFRGPDQSGVETFYLGERITKGLGAENKLVTTGLGHRRLSIIDISEHGSQPMSYLNEAYWIVFNGEIYNYLELALELKSLGHEFLTKTDTEVALAAYVEWGDECFRRFNGMWAISIFDVAKNEMILSRDRLGKKPLYLYQDATLIAFASQPKALFASQLICKEINIEKCKLYAGGHYRLVDSIDDSYFLNINQLPPGEVRRYSVDGEIYKKQYWDLSKLSEIPAREAYEDAYYINKFKDIFSDAVRIRMRSDVPVAAMLSGGLDSGSIVATAKNLGFNLKTYSSVAGTGEFDESEYIDEMVSELNLSHQYIYPESEDLIHDLNTMLKFHDEPVCTITWFSLFKVAQKIAKDGIKVVLTGHGGDELLGGYWDHYHYLWHDTRKQKGDPSAEIENWKINHGRDDAEITIQSDYIDSIDSGRDVEFKKYTNYEYAIHDGIKLGKDRRGLKESYLFSSQLNRRLYLELISETVPATLRAEDRNMMAFSMENRCPFLDHRLIEFCYSLPDKYKISKGLGKMILREAMRGVLPSKVRMRTDKTGHNVPADKWWRQPHMIMVFEKLFKIDNVINTKVYKIEIVKSLYAEHLAGNNHSMFLWQYLNLQLWFQQQFMNTDEISSY